MSIIIFCGVIEDTGKIKRCYINIRYNTFKSSFKQGLHWTM